MTLRHPSKRSTSIVAEATGRGNDARRASTLREDFAMEEMKEATAADDAASAYNLAGTFLLSFVASATSSEGGIGLARKVISNAL